MRRYCIFVAAAVAAVLGSSVTYASDYGVCTEKIAGLGQKLGPVLPVRDFVSVAENTSVVIIDERTMIPVSREESLGTRQNAFYDALAAQNEAWFTVGKRKPRSHHMWRFVFVDTPDGCVSTSVGGVIGMHSHKENIPYVYWKSLRDWYHY